MSIAIPPGPWSAHETARWTLELEDEQGLVGGENDPISVHISPDPPPSVALERPVADQYVTPQAEVQFAIAVKDNLAIRDIWLAYLRSDQSDRDRQRIEVYRGPAEPPRHEAGSLSAIEADRRQVNYALDLTPLGMSPFRCRACEAPRRAGSRRQSPGGRRTLTMPRDLPERSPSIARRTGC